MIFSVYSLYSVRWVNAFILSWEYAPEIIKPKAKDSFSSETWNDGTIKNRTLSIRRFIGVKPLIRSTTRLIIKLNTNFFACSHVQVTPVIRIMPYVDHELSPCVGVDPIAAASSYQLATSFSKKPEVVGNLGQSHDIRYHFHHHIHHYNHNDKGGVSEGPRESSLFDITNLLLLKKLDEYSDFF